MSLKRILAGGVRFSLPFFPIYLLIRTLGSRSITLEDSEKTYFVYHLQNGLLWDTLDISEFRREDREKRSTTHKWSIANMNVDHKRWNCNST
jgi:hypothetical protein